MNNSSEPRVDPPHSDPRDDPPHSVDPAHSDPSADPSNGSNPDPSKNSLIDTTDTKEKEIDYLRQKIRELNSELKVLHERVATLEADGVRCTASHTGEPAAPHPGLYQPTHMNHLTERVTKLEHLASTLTTKLDFVNAAAAVTPSERYLHIEQRIFALEEVQHSRETKQRSTGARSKFPSPDIIDPPNLPSPPSPPTHSDPPSPPNQPNTLLLGDVNLTNIYPSDLEKNCKIRSLGEANLDLMKCWVQEQLNWVPTKCIIYGGFFDVKEGQTPENVLDSLGALISELKNINESMEIIIAELVPSLECDILLAKINEQNHHIATWARNNGIQTVSTELAFRLGTGEINDACFRPHGTHQGSLLNRTGVVRLLTTIQNKYAGFSGCVNWDRVKRNSSQSSKHHIPPHHSHPRPTTPRPASDGGRTEQQRGKGSHGHMPITTSTSNPPTTTIHKDGWGEERGRHTPPPTRRGQPPSADPPAHRRTGAGNDRPHRATGTPWEDMPPLPAPRTQAYHSRESKRENAGDWQMAGKRRAHQPYQDRTTPDKRRNPSSPPSTHTYNSRWEVLGEEPTSRPHTHEEERGQTQNYRHHERAHPRTRRNTRGEVHQGASHMGERRGQYRSGEEHTAHNTWRRDPHWYEDGWQATHPRPNTRSHPHHSQPGHRTPRSYNPDQHAGHSKQINTRPNRIGCFNCGEFNHIQSNCRFDHRLRCNTCHYLGHKSRHCNYYNDNYEY